MNGQPVEIVPYPLDTNISFISVSVENFQLNAVDCWLQVYEYDANNKFLNVNRVYVPSEIYQDWGTNDQFIIDFALAALGFERKEVMVQFPE